MLTLYPYQGTSVDNIREAYRQHRCIIFVAPTGSGKTVIFSHIAAASATKAKRVLVLSDRIEIFSQNLKAVARSGQQVCQINASNKHINRNAFLFVGMIETFKRRMADLASLHFDLIILDEAHKAAYNIIFKQFPNSKILGCTATPVGTHIYKNYQHMVQSVDIPDLLEMGFLSPCRGYAMQDDFSDLKQEAGEFTEKSQYEHFNKSKIYAGVIEKWLEKAQGRKTIVFCCNVPHAEETCKAFNAAGIPARVVSNRTKKKERQRILQDYAHGVFKVLVNSNILVAGFDDPEISCVVMNRATASLTLWLQSCGRGSRIMEGKEDFIVLDFGGNFKRHGLWDAPRKWSLEAPKKRKACLGVAPVRDCPQCGAMLSASVRACGYCGYVFPISRELTPGQLVEVTNAIRRGIEGRYVSQLTVPELIELEKAKQVKATYVWRVLRARGPAAIREYAAMKGYKDGWVFEQEVRKAEEEMDGGKVEFADKKINEMPVLEVPHAG